MTFSHELQLRVYYEDTDAGGIVHHANYLRFAERGRTEFLLSMLPELRQYMKENRLNIVARHIDVEYFSSARLNDTIRLITTASNVKNSSFVMQGEMFVGDRLVCRVKMTTVLISAEFKPVGLKEDMKKWITNGPL